MHEWLVSYGTGLAAVIGIAVAGMWVQNAWRRVVFDGSEDSDGLADQRGCLGCGSATECKNQSSREGV